MDVSQVVPFQNSRAAARLPESGLTGGPVRVTVTVVVGAKLRRTESWPLVPSTSTREPPTGARITVGSSSSMISAAMPSTGTPSQAPTVLSTE